MKLLRRLVVPALLCLAPLAAFATESLDRIIAVVDDDVILESELQQGVRMAQAEMRDRGITPPSDDSVRSQVLEHLIIMKLQTQRAKDAGIKIDDRELNDVMAKVAANNNMTVPQFIDSVKSEGLDASTLREQLRQEVLASRVRQKEVDTRIVVTDQDIDQFLAASGGGDTTEYHLAHILVAIPDGATPEIREKARAKADGLLKKLHDGADFAQLAVSNSDGQQNLQGGDLGWRKGSSLPTAFASVVPKLQPGGISDVIEASNGYNIIKLMDKRETGDRETVNETRVRHILLAPNTLRNEDATRAQAFELHDRLVRGDDFTALAKKYSDDPGSKNSGGELGWQPPGVYAPEFQTEIDSLKIGELSKPFHTQFGWHIAEVEERRTRDVTEEARRARARQAIMQRKDAEEYDAWLRRLREEAYVEYRLKNTGDSDSTKTGADSTDGKKSS